MKNLKVLAIVLACSLSVLAFANKPSVSEETDKGYRQISCSTAEDLDQANCSISGAGPQCTVNSGAGFAWTVGCGNELHTPM